MQECGAIAIMYMVPISNTTFSRIYYWFCKSAFYKRNYKTFGLLQHIMLTVIQLGNLRAHSRISKINLSGERNNLLKTAQQPYTVMFPHFLTVIKWWR